MTMVSRNLPKSAALLVIAVAIPPTLASMLIMLEHWGIVDMSELTRPLPWQLIVAIVILPGLIPVSRLRWPIEWRIVVGLLLFMAMFAVLPLYALVFSCTFTGDCI